MNFDGKTVLITGASSGIGRALAQGFARLGTRLVLTARSRKALEETAAACAPAEAVVIPADLTRPADIETLCAEVERRAPAVDILVNNAGVGIHAPLLETTPESARSMFELNLLAPIELTRRLAPRIPAGGAVVNISSIAGKVPLPQMTLYCSTKFGLNAFSDGLRMELSSRDIHVLSVCPGFVRTSFGRNLLQGRAPGEASGGNMFSLTAEQCAEETIRALRRGKRTIVIPRLGWILVAFARLFPHTLHGLMAKRLPPRIT